MKREKREAARSVKTGEQTSIFKQGATDMKKLFVLAAIFALIFAGCGDENGDGDETSPIGDTGPGGGIIFFAEGGQYKECSGELGTYDWTTASTTASGYKGGEFTNWRLPDRGELELMYENLHKKGLGGFSESDYWSSTASGSWHYCLDFSDGNWDHDGGFKRVRAVRSYTVSEPDTTPSATLKIQNESFIEITAVVWNNVSFTTGQNTIKTGANITKNVEAGSGYIYFKRAGNPIGVRTSALVVIEEEGQSEFVFTNNTLITEVSNAAADTLGAFYTKPWINIKQNTATINQYGEYDYGSVLYTGEKDVTFTIENVGGGNLNFTNTGDRVYLGENSAGYFSITQSPLAASVAPGNTIDFTIRFDPQATGNNFTASAYIKTDSQNAEEFVFRVKANARDYTIGDTGPGGGLIFFAEGNQYKECSGELGSYNWDDAMTIAEAYNGGNFSDWHLPDNGEFNLMCQNLHRKNLGGFASSPYLTSYYWSSTEPNSSEAYSFYFGGDDIESNSKLQIFRVRAVRGPFTL